MMYYTTGPKLQISETNSGNFSDTRPTAKGNQIQDPRSRTVSRYESQEHPIALKTESGTKERLEQGTSHQNSHSLKVAAVTEPGMSEKLCLFASQINARRSEQAHAPISQVFQA
jgi:hypothetical protein